MNMDAAQNLFLTESRELLEEMEIALLSLESDPSNEDHINSVFRAAHTIKGTGGVFGFDQVEEFTHIVENVLDEVRAGNKQIDDELIATLLSSRDHIGILVELAVAGETANDELKTQNEILRSALKKHLASFDGDLKHDSSEESVTDNGKKDNSELTQNENWHISARFSHDVLRQGMDPLSFLRYLTRLGEIRHVSTIVDEHINDDDMNPESCYFGYEVEFAGTTDKETLCNVFEFVRDDCLLHVMTPHSSIASYMELLEALPEDNTLIANILVNSGALTEIELKKALRQHQPLNSEKQSTEAPTRADANCSAEPDSTSQNTSSATAQTRQTSRNTLQKSKSLRVDAEKLDQLVNLVGELVIAGASTNLSAQRLDDAQLLESMSVMTRLVEEIRDSTLRLRMVQIGETFSRFQRVVRDVSRELEKDITLEISGGDTELDKTVIEKIGDPLMHLVRNAMDHGIEKPQHRAATGKPGKGTLKLNAFHDSGSIVIEVSDDGKGLNRNDIIAKAVEKGLITDGQALSDQEVYRLIFEPGFSTAKEITNLSGRGVGMDVVKKNIEALRGSVDIDSETGKGSTVSIRLPLTLAIIDGFLIGVGDSTYVVPLDMVFECVELTEEQRRETKYQNYINLRGEVLPLLRLRDYFQINDSPSLRENIVVVQSGGIKAGLVVDALQGEHQTVIKPLGKLFRHLKGLSGSTILGSGEVAVILDVPGIIQKVAGRIDQTASSAVNKELPMAIH